MGWIKSFSRGNCDLLLRLKAQLACLYLIYTRTIQEEIKVSCSVSQKLKTIFYKLVNDIYVQCWIYDVQVQAEIRCWVSLQNVLKEFLTAYETVSTWITSTNNIISKKIDNFVYLSYSWFLPSGWMRSHSPWHQQNAVVETILHWSTGACQNQQKTNAVVAAFIYIQSDSVTSKYKNKTTTAGHCLFTPLYKLSVAHNKPVYMTATWRRVCFPKQITCFMTHHDQI